MKRKRLNIPPPIFCILVISFIYLFSTILEFRYIKIQRRNAILSDQFSDSFDYSLYSCISRFIQKITPALFTIGLFYFSTAIRSISNSEYEFCAFFVIAHWVVSELPYKIVQTFLLDSNFGMTTITFSSFMKEQLVEQLFLLFFLYFSVSLFLFISEKLSPYSVDTTIIDGDDNFDLSSSSSYISNEDKRLPPLEMDKEPEPPLMQIFLIFYFLIFFLPYLINNAYHDYYYDKKYYIQPNGKLLEVMSDLFTKQSMDMNNTFMFLRSKRDKHLTSTFSRDIARNVIVSDNLVNDLTTEQLTCIMASLFYRKNSQEGILLFLTYLIEFILYPFIIQFILKKKIEDDLKLTNFLSTIIPLSFVYLYILNFGFDLLRIGITKRMVSRSDVFCVDLNIPIDEALVKLFSLNKDAVMHSFFYSIFMSDEPTLNSRLINIEKAKTIL